MSGDDSRPTARIKEVQPPAVPEPRELNSRILHAIRFLQQGFTVKVVLRFRGRERLDRSCGEKTIRRFLTLITPWGRAQAPPRAVGRMIAVIVAPDSGANN